MKKRELLLMVSTMVIFFNGCSSIETKGDINSSNSMGKTAIIEAVEKSKGSVPLLIEKGANVNAKDSSGNTPLILAVAKKDIEIIKLLIEKGANVNSKNNYGDTPFMTAARNGDIETIKILMSKGVSINVKDGKGNTILIEAISRNNEEMVKFLLENGANVNVRDMWMSKRKSAIMLAVENYMPIEIIEMMIAKGAELNIKDDDGNTVLLIAVQRNNIAAVKLLVEKGAEKK
jgi:ankyrin repeat protein